MTTTTEYDRVCGKIKRWRSRLKRAVTMIDKLERQRQRMDRKAALARLPVPVSKEVAAIVLADVAAPKDDGLDVPGFFKGDSKKLGALPDPKTKEKKAQRRRIRKEARRAD